MPASKKVRAAQIILDREQANESILTSLVTCPQEQNMATKVKDAGILVSCVGAVLLLAGKWIAVTLVPSWSMHYESSSQFHIQTVAFTLGVILLVFGLLLLSIWAHHELNKSSGG